MEFSDASSLPDGTPPALHGLLALKIDLALDAVAIRFGFWNWGDGLKFQYAVATWVSLMNFCGLSNLIWILDLPNITPRFFRGPISRLP